MHKILQGDDFWPRYWSHNVFLLIQSCCTWSHLVIAFSSKERPVIQWAERDLQSVSETDLVENYKIMREYLMQVGGLLPCHLCWITRLVWCRCHPCMGMFLFEMVCKARQPWLTLPNHVLGSHAQAAFVQLTSTFNLHSQVYGVRGGRGLIKVSWPRHIICAVVCMWTFLSSAPLRHGVTPKLFD